MKAGYTFISMIFLAIVTATMVGGCSELNEEGVGTTAVGLRVHPEGWTDSTSALFHGTAIRADQWEMMQCKQCHGGDYSGGTTAISCTPCHTAPEGPEACFTCHGSDGNSAPPVDLDNRTETRFPGVGAHRECMGNTLRSKPVRCSECHVVPTEVYVAGHVDSDLPAEVIFPDSVANTVTNKPTTQDYDLLLPVTTPNPRYDPQTMSCSGTYCHGNFKNGNNVLVVWTLVGTGQINCGTCHGDPLTGFPLPRTVAQGGSHPDFPTCSLCHFDVVDGNLNILVKEKHMNGKLNVFGEERDF